jgi:hypothetical protein
MTKLITDKNDAAALANHGLTVETAADPARSALAQPSAVLVMPARDDDHALIATIQSAEARRAAEIAGSRKVAAYEAGGFLGLDDVAVYEEEQPKPWWKRILKL